MPLTPPPKRWRSTTSRRILPRSLRRSSIRSTTPPGTVWWVATLVPTSRTRRSISSISIWGRWQFYSSSRVEARPCQKTASLRQSAVAARRCDRSRG
eukprot:s758_g21.t1